MTAIVIAFVAGYFARWLFCRAENRLLDQKREAYNASVDCLATMMKSDARFKNTGMRKVV